jgi:hypothetical protein
MSVVVYPLILNRMTGYGMHNVIAILIMLLVVYLHRANIARLVNGTENKINLKSKKKDDANNINKKDNGKENGEESK